VSPLSTVVSPIRSPVIQDLRYPCSRAGDCQDPRPTKSDVVSASHVCRGRTRHDPAPGGYGEGGVGALFWVYQPCVTDRLRLARFSVQAVGQPGTSKPQPGQQRWDGLPPRRGRERRHRSDGCGRRVVATAWARRPRRVVLALCEHDSNGPIRIGRWSPRMAW
jgi:hypothetical protein